MQKIIAITETACLELSSLKTAWIFLPFSGSSDSFGSYGAGNWNAACASSVTPEAQEVQAWPAPVT